MAGKQHKREAKRAKEEVRAAARRRERQRTIQTAIVVLVAVAIGGALIFVSMDEPAEELASADDPSEAGTETSDVPDAEPCDPAPPPSPGPELPKPTFPDGPEQVLADGQDYRAVVETSCGRVVFDLFDDDAPETVNSFVFLAQQGFFDGLEIFRNATSISSLQTGSGDNTNTWDIGYTIPDELGRAQEAGGYGPGSLAMANAGANTSGSQFFMTYGDAPLDLTFTLFGEAVEGLDVLASIGAIPTQVPEPTAPPTDPAALAGVETPSETVVLESVTIESFPEGQAPPVVGSEPPADPAAGEAPEDASTDPAGSEPAEPATTDATEGN